MSKGYAASSAFSECAWPLVRRAGDRPVRSLGGLMYGDGEAVIEYRNAGSTLHPLTATVLLPSGAAYTLTFATGQRPSVQHAANAIALVRRTEADRA